MESFEKQNNQIRKAATILSNRWNNKQQIQKDLPTEIDGVNLAEVVGEWAFDAMTDSAAKVVPSEVLEAGREAIKAGQDPIDAMQVAKGLKSIGVSRRTLFEEPQDDSFQEQSNSTPAKTEKPQGKQGKPRKGTTPMASKARLLDLE